MKTLDTKVQGYERDKLRTKARARAPSNAASGELNQS